MEKLIIVIPILLFFGFFGFLVFGFLLIVFKLIMKSKNASWSGEVVDKKQNQVRDSDNSNKIQSYYYLVVKTNTGKEMKVGLSQQLWENYSVGDRIEKPKGSLYPRKVHA